MKPTFKENNRENKVDIELDGKKIAYYDRDKKKVLIITKFKENLKNVKEYSAYLNSEYNNWLYESSPLRNLSEEDTVKVVDGLRKATILSLCLQDVVEDNLKFLNDLDQFNEVTTDINRLREYVLNMTNKVSKAIGVDSMIEVGDKADEVIKILEK